MIALTDYIAKRQNLLPLSTMITAGILLFTFIMMQILAFAPLGDEALFNKRMVVQELIRLRFDRQKQNAPSQKLKGIARQKNRSGRRSERVKRKSVKPRVDIASLVKDFNTKDFISRKPGARRTLVRETAPQKYGIATDVARPMAGLTENSLTVPFRSQPTKRPGGRKAVAGAFSGMEVEAGALSANIARVTSGQGLYSGGPRGARATRSGGNGAGTAQISLPIGKGGDREATIDLNALIEWMKKHPGKIPKLVAYEMGHKTGDLSSAVTFTVKRKRYTIFLSSNEFELLLRVCLIENDDFILLKDSGIREQSHYLTVGDVFRSRGQIQSLISSRKAPGDKANRFYSIFWAWWQNVQK